MYQQQRTGAKQRECDRCGASVLRQEVGHRAALKVTADAEPISVTEARSLAEPNRLAWCLATLHSGRPELRWRCRRSCGHALVIDHRCPDGTPTVRGALW